MAACISGTNVMMIINTLQAFLNAGMHIFSFAWIYLRHNFLICSYKFAYYIFL